MKREKKQLNSTLHVIAVNKSYPKHENVIFKIDLNGCKTCIAFALARCMEQNPEFKEMIQEAIDIYYTEGKIKKGL